MSIARVIVKMKRTTLLSLVLVLAFVALTATGAAKAASGTRTITDPTGEKIEIPSVPKRIACFYQPAYDKIVMLGDPTRIAVMPKEATPWVRKFYPTLHAVSMNTTGGVPDVERLLKYKVDLVFYPKGHTNVSKIVQAGIPAVCPFNDRFRPAAIDEHTAEFKKQVLFFGDILGPEARVRAEKYCKYLDGITARIKAVTSRIREADKPRVYYGKTTNPCMTQGNHTIMRWYTELAGGIYLPKKLDKYFPEVSMEQIAAWDPDIILLGMHGSADTARDSAGFRELKAFKSGKVYKVPVGIFYWDMTSCETALLPLYLGKKFHPALFRDWDMIQEMKKFYSEIYGIELTTRDGERILKGLPPL